MFKTNINSSIFSVLFIAVFVANSFIFQNVALGTILLFLYLFVFSSLIGNVITPQEKGPIKFISGAVILISSIIIIGSLVYYAYKLTPEFIQATILLTPAVVLWLSNKFAKYSFFKSFHDLWKNRKHKISQSVWFAFALIVFFSTIVLFTYQSTPILESVRSPWERIGSNVFISMSVILLFINILLYRGRERALTIPIFSLVLFIFISMVAFVFPIGYGFDSFIHKATELHLSNFGFITPKPFYYIGQYVLVLFLQHGFSIPVLIADTFLIPVLTSIMLPIAWYTAAVHITNEKRLATTTLMGIFLLPLSGFIVTTPQALGNLWIILLILLSIPYLLSKERPRLPTLLILALATLFIHPIAGIPAMLYVALLICNPDRSPIKFKMVSKILFYLLSILASIILPLSFILSSVINKQSISTDFSALNPINLFNNLNLNIFFENKFNPILDFVYLYGFNSFIVLLAISIYALVLYKKEVGKRLLPIIIMISALTINYILLKNVVDFTFLIDYERQNYADRLVPLIGFFLIPFLILGISHFFINIRLRATALRIFSIVLITAIGLSAFYTTYPRKDAYQTHHGFNVSQADIDAVNLVESWSENEPYLVLANQSVSAAAIKEIGFRYYSDLFFYPIPTGDVLYEYFLLMNERPSRQVAKDALSIVPMHGDVNTLYYIVNNYWWQANRIIETSKNNADDWLALDNGSVFIFKYEF